MRIGEVAKSAGITVEAIRYYEKEGLVDAPKRNKFGYRDYSADQAKVISFITKAKKLGFSLKETKELMGLRYTPGATCGDIKRKAEQKVTIITERIDLLTKVRESLEELINSCTEELPVSTCPVIEKLADAREPN